MTLICLWARLIDIVAKILIESIIRVKSTSNNIKNSHCTMQNEDFSNLHFNLLAISIIIYTITIYFLCINVHTVVKWYYPKQFAWFATGSFICCFHVIEKPLTLNTMTTYKNNKTKKWRGEDPDWAIIPIRKPLTSTGKLLASQQLQNKVTSCFSKGYLLGSKIYTPE